MKELKEIPKFKTEEAEAEFWVKHDSTEYVDFSKGKRVIFPALKINNQRGYGSIIVFFMLILVAVLIYNSWKSPAKDVESTGFKLMEGDNTFSLNLVTTKLGTIPENYQFNEYDVIFSPDGKRFATRINDGNKTFILINEKKYDKFENGYSWGVLFSPNGKHFAYHAKEGNEFVVFDGQELEKYSWAAREIAFSPDSRQFAYTAGKAVAKWVVVLNGREGKTYDEVSSPFFSANGKQFAYVAGTKYGKFVILNGRRGKLYNQIRGLTFSPDSKQLAYGVKDGARTSSFVVLNDKEGKRYDTVDEGIVFSPDSKQLAYVAEENGKRFVVINGQEGKRYAYVNGHSSQRIVFSPDSSQFSYIARDENFNEFLVINGMEQKTYKNIIFSPDGKSMFFKMEDGKIYVVMNGQQRDLPKYSSNFIFSPDGAHFIYLAMEDKKQFIMVDDLWEGKRRYDHVYTLTFSSDGKYACYGARDGRDIWWVVEEVK